MNSDIADPGLFDTPLGQSTPPSHGDSSSGNCQNTRRVYRPVSEEKRKSREYRVSRDRNNRAVQRCRANNKVKQDCLVIKSEGYRALAEGYIKAAHELNTERKVSLSHSSVSIVAWPKMSLIHTTFFLTRTGDFVVLILLNLASKAL